ncbi:NAD-dependent protein deacylase [Halobacteriovorax sp. GB3]|uniref:Sir2 family NAD+-dependent deacetylase n=1 Tax=Halobacteriovorax sp. GB3 TaxID=2719615 RepID=UPI00235DC46F|nr:Sir2 family NAD+-dependent deacetylase [Halobacteriovorax sp. GB3]MDD0853422.1 NAD-dependent protein deacylase [Halobacteriovorax sp. GB3]
MSKKNFTNIVILTGAGISAESGIKTFRDQNGLWENHDILDVATPQGFERDPELVHRFYNLRRAQLLSDEVKPNQAHFALARLEKEFNGQVVIVTQNVDNLHEKAGSKNVLHMHGELLKMRCSKSKQSFSISKDITSARACPCCLEEGNLRPHIVWFGERPFHMNEIQQALSTCDLFLSIGTSGQVYPAAMFVDLAKESLAHTVEFNTNSTDVSDKFDEHRLGKAGVEVEKFVDELLS